MESNNVGNRKALWLIIFLFVGSVFVHIYLYYDNNFILNNEFVTTLMPRWTLKPASKAAAVASIDCSGHGYAYMDALVSDGLPVCDCNHCYSGTDCSVVDEYCTADVVSGDAQFLADYWQKYASDSGVLMSGWNRMSYFTDGPNYTSLELELKIRQLHNAVGNAHHQDKFIVFGNGMTQLINAVVYALAQDIYSTTGSPAQVVAWVPYYPVFRYQTKYFTLKGYEWKGNASDFVNTKNPKQYIEMVTSPNNPDGNLRKPVIDGSHAIFDLAYYWPYYTAIRKEPYDEEIMMFTMSKYSGHAGSRFGWVFLKNQTLYEKVTEYMIRNTAGVSRDTHLRMLTMIETILKRIKKEGDINEFGYNTLRNRWNQLNALVDSQPAGKVKKYTLQKVETEFCYYFNKVHDPSPSYGWLKCEEEEDCEDFLNRAGIQTEGGYLFEASKRYVRLSLIKADDDFNQLMYRLNLLIHGKGSFKYFNVPKLSSGVRARAFV